MRLFIAVDLMRPQIEVVTRLFVPFPGARFCDPAQLHITLRFMGEVAEALVPERAARLDRVARPRFSLALKGVGVFPRPRARKPPRVLWAGVAPQEPLQDLKAAIDEVLGPDPETARRGFSPHLTLARLPDVQDPRVVEPFLAAHADFSSAPFAVDAFHLYRSTLRPQGALHEMVKSYALR